MINTTHINPTHIMDLLADVRDAALVHEAMKIGDKGVSWSVYKKNKQKHV